jgi:uncharacterized protein YdeI (YjbR/CyaY-like superfamily)
MRTHDPRVDAYIAKSADFAKPILTYIRETVHSACPDVEETIKWSMPHFVYKGPFLGMAAFKKHAALHLWKGSLIFGGGERESMGQFGRLTKVSDLPSKKVLAGYVRQAMALNDKSVKVPRQKKAPPKPVVVPADLTAALKKNRKALAAFDAFPPSHKREYVQWITEAKRDETRARRITTAVEWIAKGKGRNWQYER